MFPLLWETSGIIDIYKKIRQDNANVEIIYLNIFIASTRAIYLHDIYGYKSMPHNMYKSLNNMNRYSRLLSINKIYALEILGIQR